MLKISYLLTNRGRANEIVLKTLLSELDSNHEVLIFLDEIDATDRYNGLDGRQIFKLLSDKVRRDDLYYYESDDLDVGIGFIASQSIQLVQNKLVQINKSNLKLPQGKSEHYKHFRLISKFKIETEIHSKYGFSELNTVVQHNSAFIRPISRLMQSIVAMQELNKLNKSCPDKFNVLIRDQNTWIPGEGRIEKLLRWWFQLTCPTDSLKRVYNIHNLETDTGGLNKFVGLLVKWGIYKFISKYVITLVDKIESFVILKSTENKLKVRIIPEFKELNSLDHGLLSIKIEKIDKK